MEMMNVMRLWVPAWQRGPLCSRKWSINSLWPRAGLPQGAPNVRSEHIDHIFRQSWSTWVSSFGKHLGNPWQLGFCDFGTQGWARHLWRFASLYREKLRDSTWDAILEVWRPDRGPEPVKAPSGDRRKCGVTCVVSYDVDLVEQCTKKAALWCRQRTVKPVSLDLEKCKHVGELWMPQKSPSWRGRPRACEGFWGSIIKTPQEWFPLLRLSCNLTRTDGWLDLAMEDKGTPHAVGSSSSPVRVRTATWVPHDTWHWVLLCFGDGTVWKSLL